MRRAALLPLSSLLIFLARGGVLGAEAERTPTSTDERAQRAQAMGPTPAFPPRTPQRAPGAGAGSPGRPLPTAAQPASPVRPRGPIPGLARVPTPNAGAPGAGEAQTAGLTSLSSFSGGGIPLMLGDLAPMFGPSLARASGMPASAIRVPWARGYKMADNQSPRPQDRAFVAFNFFDDLSQPAGSGLRRVKVYREFFGVEKTLFDGKASVGLRMPLNTISALSLTPGQGGTSTALGDLTVFAKGILWQDRTTGSLLSAGLAVTPPNGPAAFAGARFARGIPATSLQPFVGYIANFGDWFVQGFSGANLPTDQRVVTMYYNDIGAGYFLYRAPDPDAFLAAVVPTLEVHINTPLNHRTTLTRPGTPDVVDLTFGSSFVIGRRAVLSAGVINPVTGPRPYELEAVALLNIYFGRRRVTATPPPAF